MNLPEKSQIDAFYIAFFVPHSIFSFIFVITIMG